jgi:hypothetical protein
VPRRRASLRAAARIARLGKHIALVSRGRASFASGCSWLIIALMAVRDCSQLVEGPRRLGPKSLGRMNASPMPHSTLRCHARGRESLRATGRNALLGCMCALVYIFINTPRRRQPTQIRAAGDVETKCRRRNKARTARRWHLGIATLTPWHCRASPRHRRTSASGLPRL